MDGSRGRTVTNEPATTNYDPSQSTVVPQPVYDSALLQCSNTYCHGNFKNANPAFSPSWTDTTAAATACGTCHGDTSKPTLAERARPGGSHPVSTNCVGCHGAVVDASLKIIDKAKHMNGKLNVFGGERDF
jgi:predicted CxxxxCH...CXXCH cytochrome family protein